MTIDRYIKLASYFKFDFDLDEMISKFDGDRIDPAGILTNQNVYRDPSGVLHWQYYPNSKIRFARNFYRNCKNECKSIAQELRNLQHHLEQKNNVSNELVNNFVEHNIVEENIGLIMQQSGVTVDPHVDRGRQLTLNIGLKNSNIGQTYISGTTQIDDFYSLDLESYVMNDGDVYLLSTKYSHCVQSLTDSHCDKNRYVVTYSMMLR